MNNEAELRKEMIDCGKLLLQKGLVRGTGGNISIRTQRGFLITPSGMDYNSLMPEDLVEMDFEGHVLTGCRTPSIENRMHLAILAARRDIDAVVHVHSACAAAFACARRALAVSNDNQAVVFGGEVPVAAYASIGTPELAKNALEALGSGVGVLLANHGSLCVGSSIEEALFRCEMLEEFAHVSIMAEILGGAVGLTGDQISVEAVDLKKRYGQR